MVGLLRLFITRLCEHRAYLGWQENVETFLSFEESGMTLIARMASPLLEIALVFMRLDHAARVIVNANHCTLRSAVELRIFHCVADRVRLAIPQSTKWQRTGNEIDSTFIFARSNLVNVFGFTHFCAETD